MVLRFEPDIAHARWFTDDDSEWQRLCSIGPSGFARYVRLLHPVADDQDEPAEGDVDEVTMARLVTVLARHTSTPHDCFFGLWDGYAGIVGSAAMAVLSPPAGPRWSDRWIQPRAPQVPAAFPPEVMAGPRVRIPNRDYLLFRGPLEESGQWGARRPAWQARINSPNLMWPADHAWFVATEIDTPWTAVAGSPALAAELLEHSQLSVRRLDPPGPLPDD